MPRQGKDQIAFMLVLHQPQTLCPDLPSQPSIRVSNFLHMVYETGELCPSSLVSVFNSRGNQHRSGAMKKAPKARTCYICGRPTLLPGYDIHVMKCREIFEQREALKPAKERRACPRDPYASSGGRGFQSLDEENEVIHQNWKSSLPQCVNCGRSFLPEKLPIHQRSCTASNPAKLASSLQRSLARSNFAGGGSQKSYGDDSFDKRPLKSTAGTGFGEYRETPEFGHLIKCRDCGRNFNPESFEK